MLKSVLQDLVSVNQNQLQDFVHSRYPHHRIVQYNGQHVFAPSSDLAIPRPPRGTEIFVGNLPRNIYENELVTLFSQVAPIYNLRLMMDFSGNTRGFCFVCYYHVRDAISAVSRYNHYQIRKTTRINVHLSVNNCRLFFGKVPKELSRDEIWERLYGIIEGLVDVIVYNETSNPALNRGFFFAEFENHGQAAVAKRRLLAGNMSLWGQDERVCVDWADPEPFVEPEILSQVTILYLKNVPGHFTSRELKSKMLTVLNTDEIERVYKRNNFAFIHFSNRSLAEAAYARLKTDKIFIAPHKIEVEWARPESYSKRTTPDITPGNFCLSVPPKQRQMIKKSKASSRSGSGSGASSSSSDWDLMESASSLLADCFQSLSI